MAYTALTLKNRYQDQIAPGDDASFFRILTEADERLLESGKWFWTRDKLEFTPDGDQLVFLDPAYSAIVACRLDNLPRGVRWEESEYYEEGTGEIPITGCQSKIVDQGLVAGVRTYKVADENVETVFTLCKLAPIPLIDDDADEVLCPSIVALKMMMLAIIYEEANDLTRSMEFELSARKKAKENDDSYRGLAKEVFKPTQYPRLPRNRRSNFP